MKRIGVIAQFDGKGTK